MNRAHASCRPAAAPVPGWAVRATVESVARSLVESVEPAVVFTALAAAAVPRIATECSITVVQDDGAAFDLHHPTLAPAGDPGPRRSESCTAVTVHLTEEACVGQPGYQVTARYVFAMPAGATDDELSRAAAEVVATLLTRRAGDVVRRTRLDEARREAESKSRNLFVALESSRVIGQAVGILMSSHRLTADQGFELLRAVSQHTHRKLRDIAEDVTVSGVLEVVSSEPTRTLRLVDAKRG